MLFELEKLSFVIHKGGRPKKEFDLTSKVFPQRQLLRGAQPMIPLEGFVEHIKGNYADFRSEVTKWNVKRCLVWNILESTLSPANKRTSSFGSLLMVKD